MRGLILFFGFIFRYLGRFGKWAFSVARYIPLGLGAIFIVSNFFIDLFTTGFKVAFYHLIKTIFLSELVINEKVVEAVYYPAMYNIWDFVAILVSLLVLYNLGKFLIKALDRSMGANLNMGSPVWAILIISLLSITGAVIIDKGLGFIPIKDSLYFLVVNIKPVLTNIFSSGAVEQIVTDVAINATNSTL